MAVKIIGVSGFVALHTDETSFALIEIYNSRKTKEPKQASKYKARTIDLRNVNFPIAYSRKPSFANKIPKTTRQKATATETRKPVRAWQDGHF